LDDRIFGGRVNISQKESAMLWDLSKLTGYSIEAYDGGLGTVSDVLFDDTSWTLRWVIVDTGNWLPGRKVLLPLSALGQPNPALRKFPVKLTMQQVKGSPEENADLPVSRQMEERIYDYYAMAPYWGDGRVLMSNAMASPIVAPLHDAGTEPRDYIGTDLPHRGGDPHLRSAQRITGYHIDAIDGEIGHVEDFLVDDVDWRIRYLKVDTKNWWPGERVLISPLSVLKIEWASALVHVNETRQRVKHSPRYDPMQTVDGAYDEKFLTYYGVSWI
jgi:hypothetical protein